MIDNASKTSLSLCGIFLVSLLFSPTAVLAEYGQEKRIKKMGFVSITDDQELVLEEKYVPELMTDSVSEYAEVSEDFDEFEEIDAGYQGSTNTGSEDVQMDDIDFPDEIESHHSEPRDYFEITPIIVSPSGASIAQNVQSQAQTNSHSQMAKHHATDDRIREAAAIILHSKPLPTSTHDALTGVHQTEAYNYYNFNQKKAHNRDEFKGIVLNETHHSHEDIQLINDESTEYDGYHYDYEDMNINEGYPTVDLDYSTKGKKMGLPLIDVNMLFTAGYRVDDLDWNIAGDDDGNNPNVLSELTWTDLQMFEIKGRGEAIVAEMVVVDFKAGFGWIVEGENQDSDYLGDNRSGEFSRSNNDTDDGTVWDLSLGGGLRFHIEEPADVFYVDDLWVTLLGGYSSHRQKLEIKNGFQTIPEFGGFAGLDSRYNTEWNGPWLGVQIDGTDRSRKMYGYARFEYHFPEYEADATWNLRTDFQQPLSFEHLSDDGWGVVLDMGGHFQINQIWSFAMNMTIQDWHVDNGLDRTFFSDGTTLTTRVNDVNWNSLSLGFGFTLRF